MCCAKLNFNCSSSEQNYCYACLAQRHNYYTSSNYLWKLDLVSRQSTLFNHCSTGSPAEYRIGVSKDTSFNVLPPFPPLNILFAPIFSLSHFHLCSWIFSLPLFLPLPLISDELDSFPMISPDCLRSWSTSFKLSERPVP